MSIVLTLIGIALIGGSVFIFSLVEQAPTNEPEWWQPFVIALGEAGIVVAWIMLIIGIILLVIGVLHLLHFI